MNMNPTTSHDVCSICANPNHLSHNCPTIYSDVSHEQVNAAQGYPPHNNPYSNTYNPGWRNHPNFSWRQNFGDVQQGQRANPVSQPGMSNIPPDFQAQRYVTPTAQPAQTATQPVNENSNLDKVISALGTLTTTIQNMDSRIQGIEKKMHLIDSHTHSISKLESQIGQLANAVSKRDDGKLPSHSVENPKSKNYEHVNAVMTLRNGKDVDNLVSGKKKHDNGFNTQENKIEKESQDVLSPNVSKSPDPIPYEPKVPYPQALELSYNPKKDKKMDDILEIFKQVKINLPLLEAIQQVPAYAKFLKDMCTFKRKSKSHVPKKVSLHGQVSSILQYNSPPKLKDPGVPTISCYIGNHKIDNALLDLGSSVNLIPYSVYEKLGLGELQPANMTLQLADRSFRMPRGRIDDVLVKVDNGFFPVDFVILHIDSNLHKNNLPFILGRPFLATADATINNRTGVMDVSILNMRVKLNVFKTSSLSTNEEESACYAIHKFNNSKINRPFSSQASHNLLSTIEKDCVGEIFETNFNSYKHDKEALDLKIGNMNTTKMTFSGFNVSDPG